MTLDEEILRLCKNHFNHVEPPLVATVTKVYSKSADVKFTGVDDEGKAINVPLRNTPILKLCYGNETLNLKAGDEVMLIFQGGSVANAYIVGKL